MSLNQRSPKHSQSSFVCPRCQALAAQEWFVLLGENRKEGEGYEPLKDNDTVMASTPAGARHIQVEWTASRCFACRDFSLWRHTSLAYPGPHTTALSQAHVPNDDMPQEAAELFKEAVAVLPASRRAAAALCRASMERLVKYLDPNCPQRAKLDERLARLEGSVSSPTIDMLNVLRHVGNTALHGEQDGDGSAVIYIDEDDETIAEAFFLAINTLVDELITKPRRSAELYGTLPEGVRKAYETKAGRVGG